VYKLGNIAGCLTIRDYLVIIYHPPKDLSQKNIE
jgi:hypothetical protein